MVAGYVSPWSFSLKTGSSLSLQFTSNAGLRCKSSLKQRPYEQFLIL